MSETHKYLHTIWFEGGGEHPFKEVRILFFFKSVIVIWFAYCLVVLHNFIPFSWSFLSIEWHVNHTHGLWNPASLASALKFILLRPSCLVDRLVSPSVIQGSSWCTTYFYNIEIGPAIRRGPGTQTASAAGVVVGRKAAANKLLSLLPVQIMSLYAKRWR